jgi:GNAT superfamily N-acetyltransferase
MQIRIAIESDALNIARLHAENWRTTYRGVLSDTYLDNEVEAERAALWLERFSQPAPNQYIVVAEECRQIAGFACVYGADDPQWGTSVDNFHVAQTFRRRGVGAQLMAAVASWCMRTDADLGIYLWVLQSNGEAQKFYERLGARNAHSSVWQSPDGGAVPEFRFVWPNAAALQAGAAFLSPKRTDVC